MEGVSGKVRENGIVANPVDRTVGTVTTNTVSDVVNLVAQPLFKGVSYGFEVLFGLATSGIEYARSMVGRTSTPVALPIAASPVAVPVASPVAATNRAALQKIILEWELLKLYPENANAIKRIQSLIRMDCERIAKGKRPSLDFKDIGLEAIELDVSMTRVLIQFVDLALQGGEEGKACKALLRLTELVPDPRLKHMIISIESLIKNTG